MLELSFEYWNQLAGHLILTCALLTGFSIAITANLIINSTSNRLHNAILKVSTISSGCFLVAVFALTNILMKTTEGYPFEVTNADLTKPRIIGIMSYMIGVVSLLTVIAFPTPSPIKTFLDPVVNTLPALLPIIVSFNAPSNTKPLL